MELSALVPLGIAFVVVTIVLSLGSDVLTDIRADQTSGTYAYNATTDGLSGVSKISSKLDTIGLVVAIAVIIGLILTYMSYGRR